MNMLMFNIQYKTVQIINLHCFILKHYYYIKEAKYLASFLLNNNEILGLRKIFNFGYNCNCIILKTVMQNACFEKNYGGANLVMGRKIFQLILTIDQVDKCNAKYLFV